MNTYYITFGQKYRHEPHPLGGHPDGWIEVHAEYEVEARQMIHKLCGSKWAFIYNKQPDIAIYPRGCLMTIYQENALADVKSDNPYPL